MRRILFLSALLALISCREPLNKAEEGKPQAPGTLTSTAEPDVTNLLTMSRGAVVIHRSGELQLETSAIHAIDGTPTTSWVTPPNDPQQSVLIALPTLTRISRVGLFAPTVPANSRRPEKLSFESSTDGQRFDFLATFATPGNGSGTVPVDPREASYLRVKILDAKAAAIAIPTLIMEGTEVRPYKRPSLRGRWQLNDLQGLIAEDGARVRASVEQEPPARLEGGWSGRTIPYIYLRGRQFGYGIMTPSAHGRFINVKWWFEEAIPLFAASPWFGEQIASTGGPDQGTAVLDTWLERFGFTPLFAFEFDEADRLQKVSPALQEWLVSKVKNAGNRKLRIVSREYRRGNDTANLKSSERQIAAMRDFLSKSGVDLSSVSFSALGTTEHKETPVDSLDKIVYSRIELQFQR